MGSVFRSCRNSRLVMPRFSRRRASRSRSRSRRAANGLRPAHTAAGPARRECGEAGQPSAREAGYEAGRCGCRAARARARGTAGDAGVAAVRHTVKLEVFISRASLELLVPCVSSLHTRVCQTPLAEAREAQLLPVLQLRRPWLWAGLEARLHGGCSQPARSAGNLITASFRFDETTFLGRAFEIFICALNGSFCLFFNPPGDGQSPAVMLPAGGSAPDKENA